MNDLDPNFFLPLWRALVKLLGRQPPLVHAYGTGIEPGASPVKATQAPEPDQPRRSSRKLVHSNY